MKKIFGFTPGQQYRRSNSSTKRSAVMLGVLFTVLLIKSPDAVAQKAIPDTIAQRTAACAACHGKEGRATSEGFFPRIAGKPAGYLYNQLINFREGRRQNQQMAYMVNHLSDAYLLEMATFFSDLHLPYSPQPALNVSQTQLARGQQLVVLGDPSMNVPACVSCHGKKLTGVAPAIPGLIGLPRDYLNAQFGAWRNGVRQAAAPDCMEKIASRLSSEDISAASAWLATQLVPGDSTPAVSLAGKLPIPCGSFPQ